MLLACHLLHGSPSVEGQLVQRATCREDSCKNKHIAHITGKDAHKDAQTLTPPPFRRPATLPAKTK